MPKRATALRFFGCKLIADDTFVLPNHGSYHRIKLRYIDKCDKAKGEGFCGFKLN